MKTFLGKYVIYEELSMRRFHHNLDSWSTDPFSLSIHDFAFLTMSRLFRLLESFRQWVPRWVSLLFEILMRITSNKCQLYETQYGSHSQSVPTSLAQKSCFKPFLRFLFQHFVCFFNRIGELRIQLALTPPVFSIRPISYTTNPSESFIGWSRICIGTIISIIQIISCSSIKYSNSCV